MVEQKKKEVKVPKGTRDFGPEQMAIREKAFNIITNVFKQHGAAQIDTPVFELKETLMGKYGEESKLIYDLDDQGGELLSLRYDLTVPFARYMASHGFDQMKRFHIAKVYRRDNPAIARGRFREFYQCDFDIAGEFGKMIPDAEVLQVAHQILTTLDIGNFVIKVNHRKILNAYLDISGVPETLLRTICSSIDKLDKEPWEKVREEMLQKGLDAQIADNIKTYVQIHGNASQVLEQLATAGYFANHKVGSEGMQEMKLLIDYCTAMKVEGVLQFDLSLVRGLDYYTGLIYEAIFTEEGQVGSVAGGGRYDDLIGMFSKKKIPAVGISIGIERVLTIFEKKYANIRKTNTQFYIASIGKSMIAHKFALCSELWRNGLSAEMSYKENAKAQDQMKSVHKNEIPYILWIGEQEINQNCVKFKEYTPEGQPEKEQQIIQRQDLIAFLKSLNF